MLTCGNVINQEVLRLVCCTEKIPVDAPGTGELPSMHWRLQGTAFVFVLLHSLKNKNCIFLCLGEVALNCMRLCRSKILPDLTLTYLGFFNF